MKDRRWITPSEAGELLSLHPKTIYCLIGRNEIPHIRIGRTVRVDAKQLEENFARQMADQKIRMRGK